MWHIWIPPFSPLPLQVLSFSNPRLQGRSPCLLQSWALDPQGKTGINASAWQRTTRGFILKHNRKAHDGHLHTMQLEPRKMVIGILASFGMRKSKLIAFTSKVPQLLGLVSVHWVNPTVFQQAHFWITVLGPCRDSENTSSQWCGFLQSDLALLWP